MAKNKIAVFGAALPGLEVAFQLRDRGSEVVLLDSDEEALEAARAKGLITQSVDYRDDEELKRVGVGREISLLFALFKEESNNIFLAISARALDPALKIVSLAQTGSSRLMLQAAGADKVIDPYVVSGRKILDLIRRPLIVETLEKTVFGQQNLNIAEVKIEAGSALDGRVLDDLALGHRYNLVLLGVVDREKSRDFTFALGDTSCWLDPGDVLVVIGPQEAVARFRQEAIKD